MNKGDLLLILFCFAFFALIVGSAIYTEIKIEKAENQVSTNFDILQSQVRCTSNSYRIYNCLISDSLGEIIDNKTIMLKPKGENQ